jgi:hypothetical protein
MFFNAHVYYSMQRAGKKEPEPLRILGAVLPDSAYLTGVLGRSNDLHDRDTIEKFGAAMGDGPQASQLLAGLWDHYELDLRSHEVFEGGDGYAFSHQTPELARLVAKAAGFASAEAARGIAHNFIESGVDINLLAARPEVRDLFRGAMRAADVNLVAGYLAEYFELPADATRARLAEFVEVGLQYDTRDMAGWASLWHDLIRRLLGREANDDAVKQALELVTELTAGDYERVTAL